MKRSKYFSNTYSNLRGKKNLIRFNVPVPRRRQIFQIAQLIVLTSVVKSLKEKCMKLRPTGGFEAGYCFEESWCRRARFMISIKTMENDIDLTVSVNTI